MKNQKPRPFPRFVLAFRPCWYSFSSALFLSSTAFLLNSELELAEDSSVCGIGEPLKPINLRNLDLRDGSSNSAFCHELKGAGGAEDGTGKAFVGSDQSFFLFPPSGEEEVNGWEDLGDLLSVGR